jgi:UDP-N-acetylglucosamine 2-epimerase (non-hydrolysing)
MIKLICVGGARPNFMKLAPLLKTLREAEDFQVVLAHTGQHYDEKMSGQFFRELGIPAPDYHLEVGSGTHAQQTAEIMRRFEPVVVRERPDGVVVVGDVNSTMAAAIVAAKLEVAVVHVEAGLRSFDRTMPEEINRLVTDSISDLLLATEDSGMRNLIREGVPESRIRTVGNLMIDTLHKNLARARSESNLPSKLELKGRAYGVVTLHRPANVDDAGQLAGILGALKAIAKDLPLYFPVHPRTRARLEEESAALKERGLHLLEPLGYLDFLALVSGSALVLTDSGGVQEETTALGIPCLTLRDNTERPVTVDEGTNLLAGTTRESILAAWGSMRAQPKRGRIPRYWDGNAAERCRDALREFFDGASRGRSG